MLSSNGEWSDAKVRPLALPDDASGLVERVVDRSKHVPIIVVSTNDASHKVHTEAPRLKTSFYIGPSAKVPIFQIIVDVWTPRSNTPEGKAAIWDKAITRVRWYQLLCYNDADIPLRSELMALGPSKRTLVMYWSCRFWVSGPTCRLFSFQTEIIQQSKNLFTPILTYVDLDVEDAVV